MNIDDAIDAQKQVIREMERIETCSGLAFIAAKVLTYLEKVESEKLSLDASQKTLDILIKSTR